MELDGVNNPLNRILRRGYIFMLKRSTKDDVLKTLVDGLSDAPEITDTEALYEGIIERERLMSTGVGFGVAVPHVRLPSVKDLVMAVGIVKEGITDYESLDGMPVRIVCMIVANEKQHPQYIRALALVSQRLKCSAVRQALLKVTDANEAYDIFLSSPSLSLSPSAPDA